MDEMTEVRNLRADAPAPDRARLAPGRARLAEAATAGWRSRAVWGRRKFVIAAVVVSVTAVAVTASVLADGSDSGRTVRPAASPSINLKGMSAGELLERAARTVERQGPVTVPRAKQWIYTETVQEDGRKPPEEGRTNHFTSRQWIRYDGSAIGSVLPMPGAELEIRSMRLENGGEGDDRSPREMYRFMTTVPADGDKALKAIRDEHAIGDIEGETEAQRDYREIGVLLDTPVMPSEGLAGLYRALATLPGGEVTDHVVRNAAGRPVIALRYEGKDIGPTGLKMGDEWLLDPQTYRVVGRRLTEGGKVVGGNSTVTMAVVDKAGRRS
ncbi:CU044_5270 family protein [Streptomyces sp. NPDC001815]|uniref:CU044_5270 family protein n=1 Tax=Streptomyces sp. NPDC001815 TaxID=3154526 RepID=UPI00331DE4D3